MWPGNVKSWGTGRRPDHQGPENLGTGGRGGAALGRTGDREAGVRLGVVGEEAWGGHAEGGCGWRVQGQDGGAGR